MIGNPYYFSIPFSLAGNSSLPLSDDGLRLQEKLLLVKAKIRAKVVTEVTPDNMQTLPFEPFEDFEAPSLHIPLMYLLHIFACYVSYVTEPILSLQRSRNDLLHQCFLSSAHAC